MSDTHNSITALEDVSYPIAELRNTVEPRLPDLNNPAAQIIWL